MNTNAHVPHVIIILVNWNGKKDTLACLQSLRQVSYPVFQVLVVDNGSADDSTAVIKTSFPEVNLIETGKNLGFVGGNNLGLEYARGAGADYALLLNNDTEVEPDFLTHLVDALEADPGAGIAGPSIYYYDQPQVLWSAGGRIDWRRGVTEMIAMGSPDAGSLGTQPRRVDFVTGCALLIKMVAVEKAGMLDPRFFAYYEETEWCVRAARHGFGIIQVPASKIWHKITPAAREASPLVHYYMTRNRLLFLRVSGASAAAWLNTGLEYARTLASWTVRPKWRGKAPQRRAMLQAIRDYRAGRFGKVEQASWA